MLREGNRVKYNIIYLDPAWHYNDKANAGQRGAEHKYPVMKDKDLMALPVGDLAADNSAMFMWATWPKLPTALEVMSAYGFTYKTVAFNWVKLTKTGKQWHWGMGSWTRANSEPCLLGIKGKPKRHSASVHQIVYERLEDWNTITIEAPVEAHSKKPDIVRELIVELCGDLPRIELFARQETPGWTSLGYDIDGRDLRESIPALLGGMEDAEA
jgi:N6-adenosine-specific RNA methylase IME4